MKKKDKMKLAAHRLAHGLPDAGGEGQAPEKLVFCKCCGELMLVVPEGSSDHETICAECINSYEDENEKPS